MDKYNLTISKIETYLNSIFDGVISDNTFFASLPDTSIVKSSDWQDMVMISIPEGIQDFIAYGSGSVFVYLYARPLQSGKKNVAKMAELETSLIDAVDSATSTNFLLTRNDAFSSYDDEIDWHCNVVELIIKIF